MISCIGPSSRSLFWNTSAGVGSIRRTATAHSIAALVPQATSARGRRAAASSCTSTA